MIGQPCSTTRSMATNPGRVAGILGVAFGAIALPDCASSQMISPSMSVSGEPWIETKPAFPPDASNSGRKPVVMRSTRRCWTRSATTRSSSEAGRHASTTGMTSPGERRSRPPPYAGFVVAPTAPLASARPISSSVGLLTQTRVGVSATRRLK